LINIIYFEYLHNNIEPQNKTINQCQKITFNINKKKCKVTTQIWFQHWDPIEKPMPTLFGIWWVFETKQNEHMKVFDKVDAWHNFKIVVMK
jgi:hypothetical protein